MPNRRVLGRLSLANRDIEAAHALMLMLHPQCPGLVFTLDKQPRRHLNLLTL